MFTIIFIANLSNLFTQNFTVSGKVTDTNASPVAYANVLVLNTDDNMFVKGVSTNEEGVFIIENLKKGSYTLKVSYIGFKSYEKDYLLESNVKFETIILNENEELLDEITINYKKPTLKKLSDRLVFNVSNTAISEGSTLDVLKNTPSVIVSESGITVKNAPVRVYINNRKVQLTSDELIQLLESSSANTISSVEVITNPPASFDADSGTVINIIMADNLITGYRGTLTSKYRQGIFPRYSLGTNQFFKNDNLSLNLNYSLNHTKTIRRDVDNVGFFENNSVNEFWKSNINNKSLYKTHNINLNFDYIINDRSSIGFSSNFLYTPNEIIDIENNTIISDAEQVFLSRFKSDNNSNESLKNSGTDLFYNYKFKNESSLNVNTHLTVYDFESNQNVLVNFFEIDQQVENPREFKTRSNQETYITNISVNYKTPIKNSTLETGVKFSKVDTDSNIDKLDVINQQEVLDVLNSNTFNYKENVFASFANYTTSWKKLDLNIGLRTELTTIKGEILNTETVNTQNYFDWFPNISLTYNISDKLSVNTNFKRSIIRPNYESLNPFMLFLNDNIIVTGNPDLLPTYNNYFKFGLDFLEHFSFEFYYDKLSNNIEEIPLQDNQNNILTYTPLNVGSTEDYGFDLIFNYYPSNKFGLYAALSAFNISQNAVINSEEINLSEWSFLVILAPNVSLLKDNSLQVSSSFFAVGDNLQNLQIVKPRIVSSLNISKTILKKRATISLIIEDVFNQQDFSSRLRFQEQLFSSDNNLDNRFIKLGFRYNFGNNKLNTNQNVIETEERERLNGLE